MGIASRSRVDTMTGPERGLALVLLSSGASLPLTPLPFASAPSSLLRLAGYRGHFLQRRCSQLTQTLSAPKVVWQRWQVRWTRILMGFSTRRTSDLVVVTHSCGSSVRPYLANRARARSCWAALRA